MQIINVNYELRDGWHIFKSPELSGLYVANKDYDTAYNDIFESVRVGLKLTIGKNVELKKTGLMQFTYEIR